MAVEGYEGGVLTPEKIQEYVNSSISGGEELPKKVDGILELNNLKIENLNLENTLENNTKKCLQGISGYYGMEGTIKSGFLTTTKTQEQINEYFSEGTFESIIVLPFHQAFNNDSVNKILSSIKQLESKRKLTPEEEEVLNFFKNIDSFFDELQQKIDEIKQIDYSRIKNIGYYGLKEGEEEYGKEVFEKFNNFLEYIKQSSGKYDFIVNRLTDEGLINKKKNNQVEETKEGKKSKKGLFDF